MAGKGSQMVPAEPSQQLQESQHWEMLYMTPQSRHSGTPPHLACSPHPPTAPLSLSSPRAPGERLHRPVSLDKEDFPPSTLRPQPRAAAGSPRTELSPRSRGVWGLCAAQQPCQPSAGMGPPAPDPSLLRDSQGRVPRRSPGKRPPLPGDGGTRGGGNRRERRNWERSPA